MPKKLYLKQLANVFKAVRNLIILQRETNANIDRVKEWAVSSEECLFMLSTCLFKYVISLIITNLLGRYYPHLKYILI